MQKSEELDETHKPKEENKKQLNSKEAEAGTTTNYKLPTTNSLIVFASGAGSNAQNIVDYFRNTATSVALIVCNKAGAGVMDIARKENIPVLLIERERY